MGVGDSSRQEDLRRRRYCVSRPYYLAGLNTGMESGRSSASDCWFMGCHAAVIRCIEMQTNTRECLDSNRCY